MVSVTGQGRHREPGEEGKEGTKRLGRGMRGMDKGILSKKNRRTERGVENGSNRGEGEKKRKRGKEGKAERWAREGGSLWRWRRGVGRELKPL